MYRIINQALIQIPMVRRVKWDDDNTTVTIETENGRAKMSYELARDIGYDGTSRYLSQSLEYVEKNKIWAD